MNWSALFYLSKVQCSVHILLVCWLHSCSLLTSFSFFSQHGDLIQNLCPPRVTLASWSDLWNFPGRYAHTVINLVSWCWIRRSPSCFVNALANAVATKQSKNNDKKDKTVLVIDNWCKHFNCIKRAEYLNC